MAESVADFLLNRLKKWGVRRVFGYPGDGIGGIVGALEGALDEDFEFVQVRHEEEAAFMACAQAKFTGEVGVCLATSGPGAIHLLNGLYDAKLDHQPVLAIVGQQVRAAIGGHFQQEVDLISLYKDVAGEYVHMCTTPPQIRHLIDRALRIAKARRTVTCVIVPNDVQEMDYEDPPREHGAIHSGMGYAQPRIVPGEAELRRAADALNAGERVAMLVGAGALKATDEVIETADILGAGIAKALLGRTAVPDELPFVTGQIGLLGTRPSWEMMRDCDTLLMVGSSFPYSEFLPKEGQTRGVQIDIDARMVSIRYPMEVNLVGDAAETLRALMPYLDRKTDRRWREELEKKIRNWGEGERERAELSANPLNPQYLFWKLSDRLPDNASVTADSGPSPNCFARALKFRRGHMASLSGTLATMCPGVPYATAAKFCYPDRLPIAFVGDGAMQMLGINGLITIAKYWEQWSDPRLIVAVLNNSDLNQVTWELRAMGGFPKVEATQNLPEVNFAKYADLLGLKGIRVEEPDQVAPAWEEALRADRPVVIDAVVDPNVVSMPPHVTYEQARNFAKSLLSGDPDRYEIIKQSLKRSRV